MCAKIHSIRVIAPRSRKELLMTRNELELLNMIREHDDPEIALTTALDVIISYLEQGENDSSL